MSNMNEERWREIQSHSLKSGFHEDQDAFCVMEAAAYVAGEPWSDHPVCACPVITAFMMAWNDGLPNDADRDRLLKPLIPKLINSRSTKSVQERRSYLALDWLIRVHAPKWLMLVPSLKDQAQMLASLPEIMDMAGAAAAGEKVSAAGDAAWAAARDAARDAAWAAARDAAWAAAWAAARDAAGDAARDAAWDAAWAAARAAARAAAWAAAGDAARDAAWAALKPTTEWLQTSALDLVNRMLEVRP